MAVKVYRCSTPPWRRIPKSIVFFILAVNLRSAKFNAEQYLIVEKHPFPFQVNVYEATPKELAKHLGDDIYAYIL